MIRSLDQTRPVTCGLNLMVMDRYAKGQGIYKDGQQKTNVQSRPKEEKVNNGSLAFNILATFVGSGMNKGGNAPKVDALASPMIDALDIAGYNYGSGRYPLEGKQHPDRIIFGSETFPQDIYKNWQMVKKYPYLLGDFMWTAWDYLGEAGIGAWSYTGGMPFNRPYPWMLAGQAAVSVFRLGNLARQSFNELLQSPVWDAFFCREHTQPQLCDGCQMARFCGGHCKRLQPYMCCSREAQVCGYQQFLLKNKERLGRIAMNCRKGVYSA